ncbi:MAG: T9SS type A sorting domain-containing protein [Candidatus Kapabacteria bacterium]|nr:T9SS type A sorting domain-containing protein [Candidatus Kapabacteria bacterium]
MMSFMQSSLCRHTTIFILCLVAGFATFTAQDRKPPAAETVLSSGNTGTEFFITIPPNEVGAYPVVGLEVYVASAFDAEVKLFDYAGDKETRFKIKAMEILTLSDNARSGKAVLNWSMENRDVEIPIRKALRLRSDKPISVYVINSKQTTTDGYMAIPTSSWGTEYIPCSYWDFKEIRPWAGGFTIIAKEPTKLTIQLRGAGKGLAKTSGGKSIGDVIDVTLDEGEVYMVHGDGTTRGEFDLTGSLITADKPVGVIGFHMRTTMPNMLINGNGRNHLCEMIPPTTAWGKRFATLELQRARLLAGRGDVFRVVCKDDDTRWTCKFYDKSTGNLLGQRGGLLKNAGDFADEVQAAQPTASVEGFSVWEADKPILLMQYSCSSTWDGDQILDPFMMCIAPEEQFSSEAVFTTPTMGQFSRHYLSLVVKVDTTDPNLEENLKSIAIDGQPVWNNVKATKPSLLFSRMPNGMYFAGVEFGLEARSHRITSNGRASFSGYVYGFGSVDAYGWPLALSRSVETKDTMRPLITKAPIGGACGGFRFEATELRNIPDPPRATPQAGDQVESGIASIDTVPGMRSTNYRIVLVTDQMFPNQSPYKKFTYEWTVIDGRRPARAVYAVSDFAGNKTIDSLIYTPATTVDTAKPAITRTTAKNTMWDIAVTEESNRPNPPRSCPVAGDQVDRGLSEVTVQRVNMRYVGGTMKFSPDSMVPRTAFSLFVEDASANAMATITARDRAGNISTDTIRYSPTTSVAADNTPSPCVDVVLNADRSSATVTLTDDATGILVQVFDLRGRLMATTSAPTGGPAVLDLTGLQTGLYLVSVTGPTLRCTRPLFYAH